ncbi:putaive dehydrogenase [Bacillus sp. TS-2]|nr:putaive dehydrogenase [Bacillus sp. TS-2]
MLKVLFKLPVIALLLVLFLFAPEKTLAESNFSSEDVEVVKTDTSIYLKWNELKSAERYRVLKDSEIIFEGKLNEFLVTDLLEGEVYQFHIIALNENDYYIDSLYLKVYTEFSMKSEEDLSIDTVISNQGLTIYLPYIEGAGNYKIYKDEMFFKEINTPYFTDNNININDTYQYDINVSRPYTMEELMELNKELEENAFEDVELNSEPISYQYEFSVPVHTKYVSPKSHDELEFSIYSLPTKSTIRHRAIIMDRYVKDPASKYYMGGDHRTNILAHAGTHRTQFDVSVLWTQKTSIQTAKNVGASHKYEKLANGTYKLIATKTASSVGMTASAGYKNSSRINMEIHHEVPNPFYNWPFAKYNFTEIVYRDGTTTIKGKHSQFPSLGIWRTDGGSYRTLYTYNHGNKGPSSIFLNKSINITKK